MKKQVIVLSVIFVVLFVLLSFSSWRNPLVVSGDPGREGIIEMVLPFLAGILIVGVVVGLIWVMIEEEPNRI
jgi:hypothetical protein